MIIGAVSCCLRTAHPSPQTDRRPRARHPQRLPAPPELSRRVSQAAVYPFASTSFVDDPHAEMIAVGAEHIPVALTSANAELERSLRNDSRRSLCALVDFEFYRRLTDTTSR